jgi:hypothetical protein
MKNKKNNWDEPLPSVEIKQKFPVIDTLIGLTLFFCIVAIAFAALKYLFVGC